MIKVLKTIVTICLIVVVAAAGFAAFLVFSGNKSASAPLAGTRADVMNVALDTFGVKEHLDSAMHANSSTIAQAIGVSPSEANAIIDALAISDWKAVPLPESATPQEVVSIDAEGMQVKLTTYDDPSIVTLGAYGQEATLQIPASAQDYLPLLQSLASMR